MVISFQDSGKDAKYFFSTIIPKFDNSNKEESEEKLRLIMTNILEESKNGKIHGVSVPQLAKVDENGSQKDAYPSHLYVKSLLETTIEYIKGISQKILQI